MSRVYNIGKTTPIVSVMLIMLVVTVLVAALAGCSATPPRHEPIGGDYASDDVLAENALSFKANGHNVKLWATKLSDIKGMLEEGAEDTTSQMTAMTDVTSLYYADEDAENTRSYMGEVVNETSSVTEMLSMEVPSKGSIRIMSSKEDGSAVVAAAVNETGSAKKAADCYVVMLETSIPDGGTAKLDVAYDGIGSDSTYEDVIGKKGTPEEERFPGEADAYITYRDEAGMVRLSFGNGGALSAATFSAGTLDAAEMPQASTNEAEAARSARRGNGIPIDVTFDGNKIVLGSSPLRDVSGWASGSGAIVTEDAENAAVVVETEELVLTFSAAMPETSGRGSDVDLMNLPVSSVYGAYRDEPEGGEPSKSLRIGGLQFGEDLHGMLEAFDGPALRSGRTYIYEHNGEEWNGNASFSFAMSGKMSQFSISVSQNDAPAQPEDADASKSQPMPDAGDSREIRGENQENSDS